MERISGKKISVGLLFVIMVMSIFFSTGVFAADVQVNGKATGGNVVETAASATAATSVLGVDYRGHIQDIGNYPKNEVVWVHGPEQLGTTGERKRIEGFWIKLTGGTAIPAGASIRYNVHIQNEGWQNDPDNLTDTSNWKADGAFAGSTGKSQRIEAIEIVLVGADGKSLPGYSVQYQVHGEDYGWTQGWKADGQLAGTTGQSLRLEAIQIKITQVAATAYDKAGTYGPATGTKVVNNNVTVDADGVTLQNLHIKGNLTISEKVGDGTVNLNNVTVDGQTYVRGGGEHSIHINGGSYNNIVVEKTAGGNVRIVAQDATGAAVVISEDAKGQDIILEGAFDSVAIKAPDVKVSTQGDTKISELNVAPEATGSEITLDKKTTVDQLAVNAPVEMKGEGTVQKANVNSNDVTFEQKPVEQTVAPEVTTPPVVTPPAPDVPAPTPAPTQPTAEELLVAQFNNAVSRDVFVTLLNKNELGLGLTGYATLDATGKDLVGSDLFNDKPFANKTALQSAVNDAITNAKVDADARAYMAALEAYAPALENTDVGIKVTYPNNLTDAQKAILKDLYGDIIITCQDPLEEGETLEVTAYGKTKTVTGDDFTGNEVSLSKLLDTPLGEDNLVANNQSEFTLSIKEKSLTKDHHFVIYPGTTRNSTEFYKIIQKGMEFDISHSWPEAYQAYEDSVVLSSGFNDYFINNQGGLSGAVQSRLAGCQIDTVFNFGRPLADGEVVKLKIGEKLFELTNQIVTAANGNKIRLSELPEMSLTDLPLAASYTGGTRIDITDKTLYQPVWIDINSALTKADKTLVYTTSKGSGCLACPDSYDHYMDAIGISNDADQITVDYTKVVALSTADKAALNDFYSDITLYLSRPLENGEVVKFEAGGKEIAVDSGTITDADRTRIRLSKLMNLPLEDGQKAAVMTTPLVIKLTDYGLKSDLYVTACLDLVKSTDDIVQLSKAGGMYVRRASVDAFINSITPATVENSALTFSYAGKLTDEEKKGVADCYVDEWVCTDRPLTAGESLTLNIGGQDYTLTADNKPDIGFTLSEFMNKSQSAADLAANKSGTDTISVSASSLTSDIQLSVQPMIIKSNVFNRMLTEKGLALTLQPDFVSAYTNAVDVKADDNSAAFTVTYLGNLSESLKTWLSDYDSDAIITLNRKLEAEETLTVSAFNQTIHVDSATVTQNEGTEIRLSDLLDITLADAQRADLQTGSFDITIVDRQLKDNLTVSAVPILAKKDGSSLLHLNKQAVLNVGKILPVEYAAYVQSAGWQQPVSGGAVAGTTGAGQRITALKIMLPDSIKTQLPDAKIEYQGFKWTGNTASSGWTDYVSDGAVAGVEDGSAHLEAVNIRLVNMPGYSVQYQVKIPDDISSCGWVNENGWGNWVCDNQMAGSTGLAIPIEAIRIRIVQIP